MCTDTRIKEQYKESAISDIQSYKRNGLEEALEDVRMGRIYQAESVEDMFEQIFGKDWRRVCGLSE